MALNKIGYIECESCENTSIIKYNKIPTSEAEQKLKKAVCQYCGLLDLKTQTRYIILKDSKNDKSNIFRFTHR